MYQRALFSQLTNPICLKKSYNHKTSRRIACREFIYFALGLCLLSIPIQPACADIVQGQNDSKLGKHLDLGLVKIPWSLANNHFGYVYSIEGLSFANVSDGPTVWKTSSYKSYDGFTHVDALNKLPALKFSCPDKIVFSTSSSREYKNDYRGILLFKYQGIYGAIDFIQIENKTLLYRYWYNTSGQCDFNFSIAYSAEEGRKPCSYSVRETVTHEFDRVQEHDQLEIADGDTYIYNAGLKVKESLKISNGTLIMNGQSAYIHDIEIKDNGHLAIYSEATLYIYGDFINQGTFSANGGTVVFLGDAPQIISGKTVFYYLEIDNTSYVTSAQVTVEELSVFKGTFIPGENSVFHNIFIDQEGILAPVHGAGIAVTGSLDNTGKFFHNHGTVSLAGENRQFITLNGDNFYNLTITGIEIVMEAIHVEGELIVAMHSELSILSEDDELTGDAFFLEGCLPRKDQIHQR